MGLASESTRERLAWYDRLALFALALYGALAALALLLTPRFFLPAEDAVILWGYSRNLALHHAITYFAGGPHTEGATDFAWMVLVAAAMKCGLDPALFTAIVNVVCLFLLALLLLRLARIRTTVFRTLIVTGAACLFPQVFAAASGFATLPDAVLLTFLVVCVYEDRVAPASLAALLFCTFRPEGVVFAIPLLTTMLRKPEQRTQRLATILLLFAGLGAAYFAWRAWYFGELFPLPFLVKSDTRRVLHLVNATSVRTSLSFVLFSALALWPLWRRGNRPSATPAHRTSNTSLAICLLVIPTLFYWCMRLDQNVGFRFFFYLPLGAAILLAVNWRALDGRHTVILRTGFGLWLVLLAMPLRRELRTFLDLQSPDLRAIALDLGRLPHPGTILSSEAGILPFYSGWPSTDPWGLNTAEFAHRLFQPQDVARLAPDLIHLHADQDESCLADATQETTTGRSWKQMIRAIVAGADAAQYDLWLTSYGSEHYRLRKHWSYGEGDRDCWFLRKDSPDHDAIVAILSRHHGVGGAKAHQLEAQHAAFSHL